MDPARPCGKVMCYTFRKSPDPVFSSSLGISIIETKSQAVSLKTKTNNQKGSETPQITNILPGAWSDTQDPKTATKVSKLLLFRTRANRPMPGSQHFG